jgi:uncharacterized protein YciI
MFVVLLTYLAPVSEIDARLADHVRFLDAGYADGLFLASGRQTPRTGGVILARAASRAALETALAKDPFAVHNLARYDIVEFTPTKTTPDLACLREEPKG